MPLNKLAPDRPGKTSSAVVGNSYHARTNSAGSDPLGNRSGQNGAESHWGIIRVPDRGVARLTLMVGHTFYNTTYLLLYLMACWFIRAFIYGYFKKCKV